MNSSARSAVVSPPVVWAVVRRPSLWATACRQIARMAPRKWWSRPPFLPVPSEEYLEFRMVTQYGGGHGAPLSQADATDVVDYLRWCKDWNRADRQRARSGRRDTTNTLGRSR